MECNTSERYSRQIMLDGIGESGQQKLREASVLVVGAGGLGAPVTTYLTGAGIGHIGIADPDTVSLSNLQRQTLYREDQVGKRKTECAVERLSSLSSDTRFTIHNEGLTPLNARGLVSGYDLIIDCTDNFATRYLIDETCWAEGKPWVHGAIAEFRGMLSVFNHMKRRRYTDLFPNREEMCGQPPKVTGVIGALPGAVGALQAAEAIKLITGAGEVTEGKLFTIDLLTLHTALIEF